jgi:hypothetical protein
MFPPRQCRTDCTLREVSKLSHSPVILWWPPSFGRAEDDRVHSQKLTSRGWGGGCGSVFWCLRTREVKCREFSVVVLANTKTGALRLTCRLYSQAIEVKLSLCLIKLYAMKTYWRSGGNFGAFLTSALDGSGQLHGSAPGKEPTEPIG